jgi:hypothetical protein
MKTTCISIQARRWLRAAAVVVGVTVLVGQSGTGLAQVPPGAEADHLKCYTVVKDQNIKDKVIIDLFNKQFGTESECSLLTKAPLFCAPSAKAVGTNPPGDDPRGPKLESDFLCYRVRCPKLEKREIPLVDDQFGKRSITIKSAQLVCAPATKMVTPPTPCGQSFPECNGTCDTGQECKQDVGADTCSCQPNP